MHQPDSKLLDELAVIYARAAVDRLLAEHKDDATDDDEREATEAAED